MAYAADRGVRVMGEFDLPGHSGWARPLADAGALEFCGDAAQDGSMYDDAANVSTTTLVALLGAR